MARCVDYDSIAAEYADRYRRNTYDGVSAAVTEFLRTDSALPIALEAGCGTGFWLESIRGISARVYGIDPAAGMLRVARSAAPAALLARARAEWLPFATRSIDRVFCINALHHFGDPSAFFAEARRVLRPGGAVFTAGLDPHTGRDRWWIYDYFPESLAADRERYRAASVIRDLMRSAGFQRAETREVQHIPRTLSLSDAQRMGFVDRSSTSQLMVISDDAYASGLGRLQAAAAADPAFLLRSDLRVYGTTAWL